MQFSSPENQFHFFLKLLTHCGYLVFCPCCCAVFKAGSTGGNAKLGQCIHTKRVWDSWTTNQDKSTVRRPDLIGPWKLLFTPLLDKPGSLFDSFGCAYFKREWQSRANLLLHFFQFEWISKKGLHTNCTIKCRMLPSRHNFLCSEHGSLLNFWCKSV